MVYIPSLLELGSDDARAGDLPFYFPYLLVVGSSITLALDAFESSSIVISFALLWDKISLPSTFNIAIYAKT